MYDTSFYLTWQPEQIAVLWGGASLFALIFLIIGTGTAKTTDEVILSLAFATVLGYVFVASVVYIFTVTPVVRTMWNLTWIEMQQRRS